MPIQTDSLNRKLYDLLKTRQYNPIPKDSTGETSPVPDEADIFKFTFKKDGKEYGDVWATIDSSQTLIIYYDDSVADSDDENTSGTQFTDSWSGLLQHLKNWAQRRQLSFELRNKDHLSSDMAQRSHMKKQENIAEGAKWRQEGGKGGATGLGKTFVKQVTDYGDRDIKVPIGRDGLDKDSEPIEGPGDQLSYRKNAGVSTRGEPLLPKNAQKNLKGMIGRSKGKHGPVGVLPENEQLAELNSSTLKSYKKKAAVDVRGANARLNSFDKETKSTNPTKDQATITKRNKGYALANKKLDKKEVAEGYYPMGKKGSYSDAVPTTKIILQHTRQIEEGEQRYRNIAKIFVENTEGERFAVPTVKPGIARVYARHIAEGGTPYDERGKHITSLVEEYTKMAGFVRATRNKQFNESVTQLISEGTAHYMSLRESLHKMTGHRGYNAYFESWTPTLVEEAGEESSLGEMFVQETLDPRIESVMPILSRLHKKISEMTETVELEEWANKIVEGPEGIPEEEELEEDVAHSAMPPHNPPAIVRHAGVGAKKHFKVPTAKKKHINIGNAEVDDGILNAPTKKIKEEVNTKWTVTYWVEEKSYDDRPGNEYEDSVTVMAPTADEAFRMVKERPKQIGKMRYDFRVAPAKPEHDDLDEDNADDERDERFDAQVPADEPEYKWDGVNRPVRAMHNGRRPEPEDDDVVEGAYGDDGDSWEPPWEKKSYDDERDPDTMPGGHDDLAQREMDDEELEEALGQEQERAGQLGPTEKVGPKGAVGKLVGACESVEPDELSRILNIAGIKKG